MTIISGYTIHQNFWFGWVGLIFFGVGTLLFLIKVFNQSFKWVNDPNPNSHAFIAKTDADFKALYNNNGIFTYSDNGFVVKQRVVTKPFHG